MPTVYVTAPRDAAERIAREVIEDRLAACVNVVDCESTYRWEGAIHEEAESILFIKTTESTVETLMERVEAIHPHDVPCIERFEEARVASAFHRWRAEVVD